MTAQTLPVPDLPALTLDPTFESAIAQRDFRDAMASLAATACVRS